jgi:hypothetical protein
MSCRKRETKINEWSAKVFDLFWSAGTVNNTMQYIVVKQIAIDAASPEEAITKAGSGVVLSLTATLRNPPPAPPVR